MVIIINPSLFIKLICAVIYFLSWYLLLILDPKNRIIVTKEQLINNFAIWRSYLLTHPKLLDFSEFAQEEPVALYSLGFQRFLAIFVCVSNYAVFRIRTLLV